MAPGRAKSSRAQTHVDDLGRHFGADLYEREVRYLMQAEWARRAADVLWRRSKLGLRLASSEQEALDQFMLAQAAPAAAA
jgi:glycerol-3-phosphate dehydrogenase